MLAMVAITPKAAAGFTILRERSDMCSTLPGPTGHRGRGPQSRECLHHDDGECDDEAAALAFTTVTQIKGLAFVPPFGYRAVAHSL